MLKPRRDAGEERGPAGVSNIIWELFLWVFYDCGRFNENDMIMVVPRRIFRLGFLVLE